MFLNPKSSEWNANYSQPTNLNKHQVQITYFHGVRKAQDSRGGGRGIKEFKMSVDCGVNLRLAWAYTGPDSKQRNG